MLRQLLPSTYATVGKPSYKSIEGASTTDDPGLAENFGKRSPLIWFNRFSVPLNYNYDRYIS